MQNIALTTLVASLTAGSAIAADIKVTIEIPRLNVVEYHKPYVAAWLESSNRKLAANLTVWYDIDLPKDEGETWLKDLRQWWRKSGRTLDMPVEGISGPTQPVGEHALTFNSENGPFAELPAGDYTLVVEASREVGGRELVRIPFSWPTDALSLSAEGNSELATVKLDVKPNN